MAVPGQNTWGIKMKVRLWGANIKKSTKKMLLLLTLKKSDLDRKVGTEPATRYNFPPQISRSAQVKSKNHIDHDCVTHISKI